MIWLRILLELVYEHLTTKIFDEIYPIKEKGNLNYVDLVLPKEIE